MGERLATQKEELFEKNEKTSQGKKIIFRKKVYLKKYFQKNPVGFGFYEIAVTIIRDS